MRKISKTLLATSSPANILESDRAIPYEGDDDGFDHGVLSFTLKGTKTNYILYGAFKIEATLEMPINVGFGKTCWGGEMQAEIEVDENDPNSATLAVTDDTFTAGKIIGLNLNLTFILDTYHIHYKHWYSTAHSWSRLKSFQKGPYEFNAVAFLSLVVGKLLTLGDAIPLGDIIASLLPQNVDTGSYYDKKSGIAEKGSVSLEPKVVGDVDLINFVTTIGEDLIRAIFLPTGAGELVVDLILALDDVLLTLVEFANPTLAFGPSFGFSSPVDINITDFSVADSKFEVKSSDGKKIYGEGSDNSVLPDDISGEKVSLSFTANSEYDLLAGGFIQVTWLKVLSLEKRKVKTVLNEEKSTRDSEFYNLIGAQDLSDSEIYNKDLDVLT